MKLTGGLGRCLGARFLRRSRRLSLGSRALRGGRAGLRLARTCRGRCGCRSRDTTRARQRRIRRSCGVVERGSRVLLVVVDFVKRDEEHHGEDEKEEKEDSH